MPAALFICKNLIGDTLYIQPALQEWARDHEGWDIDILTLDDHIACLFEGMGIPNLRVIFNPEDGPANYDHDGYSFTHNFDVSEAFSLGDKKKVHISTAYAAALGYDLVPRKVVYNPPASEWEPPKGLILLSMRSNSCASQSGKPPNKMLSWAHWMPILTMCRQLAPVGVLGGLKERVDLPVSQDEYYTGLPLSDVARLLKEAKLLITIDNGMAHLAATQETPTILFYPQCLGLHWIVPAGNPNLLVMQMDPIRLQVAEAVLLVRKGIEQLWKD